MICKYKSIFILEWIYLHVVYILLTNKAALNSTAANSEDTNWRCLLLSCTSPSTFNPFKYLLVITVDVLQIDGCNDDEEEDDWLEDEGTNNWCSPISVSSSLIFNDKGPRVAGLFKSVFFIFFKYLFYCYYIKIKVVTKTKI